MDNKDIEKNNKQDNNKWYSPHRLLSRDKMINFVMSHRGGGKTYSAKRLAIKNFIKKGEQFIYLRRYKTELKGNNIAKFFDDISHEFEGHKFSVKQNTFYKLRFISNDIVSVLVYIA